MPTLSNALMHVISLVLYRYQIKNGRMEYQERLKLITFLITVVLVTKLNDWKIIPTLFLRNLRRDFSFNLQHRFHQLLIFLPSISSMRLIVRINVDLPAP